MPNVVATKTKVGTKTKVAIAIAVGAGILALANAIVPLVSFSVTMKAPVSKAVLSGVTTLAASTSESAVAVSFVVSGLPTPIAGVNKDGTGKTWAATWDTSAVADGSYSVYAKAKNAKGSVATSARVLFTVSNKTAAGGATGGATSPGFSVKVTAPFEGATLSGVTALAASTSESAAAVSFVISGLPTSIAGVNKDGTGKTWVASWDTTAAPDGSYSVYATAKNSSGAVATSAKVLFKVSNPKALVAPTVTTKTQPTISLASLPTTVLTNGIVTLYRFTVTAGSTGDVSLKKLAFKVTAASAGGTVSTAAVRELGGGVDVAATSDVASSGSNCGWAASSDKRCVRVVFDAEQVIAAGTSKTYNLRVTTSGFATGDSLSTELLGDASAANGPLSGTAPATGIAGTQYDFLWSDNSAVPHGETTSDWFNGYYAVGLPGGAQTLMSS